MSVGGRLSTIRKPAVAGTFYPSNSDELRNMVKTMLSEIESAPSASKNLQAIIAPHAGYIYSGLVAAKAYSHILELADQIKRVVILGPAHRVAVRGMALSSVKYFNTPLGNISIDQDACKQLKLLPHVTVNDSAHELEHSIEVQLPFLQVALNDFTLVPVVVGETSPEDVFKLLEFFSEEAVADHHTLIVISTDLSHFESYDEACSHDKRTNQSIEALDYNAINYGDACGRNPLNGLLYFARKKDLHIEKVALKNSGDVSGDHHSVVGYGAYILSEKSSC